MIKKDEQLSLLQMQIMGSDVVTESAVSVVAKSFGNPRSSFLASKDAEIARGREQRAIELAQDTVESLQRQLSQRNALVDKYRNMLKSIRRDVLAQKEVK